MQIVIEVPEEEYNTGQLVHYFGVYSDKLDKVIYDGTPLPEHHGFIAICDNDYPLSEEVIDDLKSTAFMGDIDDSGKVTYFFTIEEIIEGSDAE